MKLRNGFYNLIIVFVIAFYSCLSLASNFLENNIVTESNYATDVQKIQEVIDKAKLQIYGQKIDDQYWSYPSHLGTMYLSQYYLLLKWLGIPHLNSNFSIVNLNMSPFASNTTSAISKLSSKLDPSYLQNLLINSQLNDGSWEILHDENYVVGNINATIMNYAALKAMGLDLKSDTMRKARKYILANGGIEKSSLFTKVVLALFNNYSWDNLPRIPYLVFNEKIPFLNYRHFAQWIGPHLFPIAYFRRLKVNKDLGALYDLGELYTKVQGDKPLIEHKNSNLITRSPSRRDQKLIRKMLALQKPHGSFGGYTSATLFSMIAFNHYQSFRDDLNPDIDLAEQKGFSFVESMYLDSGASSYLGVTCDGRYWDTALVAQGLLESGIEKEKLDSTAKYILSIQDKESGGFGFGIDFETYMDTDDTAEILLFLKKQGYEGNEIENAIQWLNKMQNRDGGWGAFDRNNNGNFILSLFTGEFLDSADMFDESSVDVTGHILEAYGEYGYKFSDHKFIKKAVKYLRKQQNTYGAWLGRWGVNYIYGTSASVIGLHAVGLPQNDDMIAKAAKWLLDCHNEDGGYGESFYSYTNIVYQCHGKSTPTQTAWALMGLIAAGKGHTEVAHNAAMYLIKEYELKGDWIDDSFVGTGHPRIVPMSYPAYSRSFTMMALSRYLKSL